MKALSFVVVCEAAADFETTTGLIDNIVCQSVSWLETGVVAHSRHYHGIEVNRPFLLWKEVTERSRRVRVRHGGHFDGIPGVADALVARRAILTIQLEMGEVDAIILVRDADNQVERGKGLEQAREESELKERIVIALAVPMRECWVLAGFEPAGDREFGILEELRDQLKFDPRETAQRLTAKHEHEIRSPKRVLGRLTGENREREAACWQEAPLRLLRERGVETGLATFIEEVEKRIVPLFVGHDRAR